MIQNHKFVSIGDQPVIFESTHNVGGEIKPEAIVIHYTGGGSVTGCVDTFRTAGVSAHLIVGRNDQVVQMVPFNIKAFHAGKSEWAIKDANGKSITRAMLNGWSIGIEVVNYGPLIKSGDQYRSRWGNVVEGEPFIGYHANGSKEFGYWQNYTCTQLTILREIVTELRAAYAINLVLGHDEIAPNRKIDPGPAFPWILFRKEAQNLLYVKERM